MDWGRLYDREIDRCNRCIPILGIAFWVCQYRNRLAIENREDEAYREIMATMEVFDPRFANDSSEREKRVMWGQIPGQVISTSLTLGLYASGYLSPLTLFSAWGLALVVDGVGGALQGHRHEAREDAEGEK